MFGMCQDCGQTFQFIDYDYTRGYHCPKCKSTNLKIYSADLESDEWGEYGS